MKRNELKYLVRSFENAPIAIKEDLWWQLVRDWLKGLEAMKWETGHWDYDKDPLPIFRDEETKKEMKDNR